MKEQLRFLVKCPVCGKTMNFDDKDYFFKGKFDNYYVCECKRASAILEVRYNRVSRLWLHWLTENDDEAEMCISDQQKLSNYVKDTCQGDEFD